MNIVIGILLSLVLVFILYMCIIQLRLDWKLLSIRKKYAAYSKYQDECMKRPNGVSCIQFYGANGENRWMYGSNLQCISEENPDSEDRIICRWHVLKFKKELVKPNLD